MTIHRQHYVWRYYLEAWQNEEGLVHCSRHGRLLPPTNPANLMVERDFYQLPRITSADAHFLEDFIIAPTGSVGLKEAHRNLVAKLRYISEANEIVQRSDRASLAEKRNSQALVVEIEEKLQGQVEEEALPILDELRQKQTDFINNYESTMAFYRFIAHQYFRTKRIRDAIGEGISQILPDQGFDRLRNIVCHLHAENLGSSLFVDRNEFDIIFMESRNGRGFITGDQPIVNLMGKGGRSETTELALYYPVSPVLSCLVSPRQYGLRTVDVPDVNVGELNELIASESKQFLVAGSDAVLRHILNKSFLKGPTAHTILDSLGEGRR